MVRKKGVDPNKKNIKGDKEALREVEGRNNFSMNIKGVLPE